MGLLYDSKGTSLIRNNHYLGPYSRTVPRALWWSHAGARFLVSEVPLQDGAYPYFRVTPVFARERETARARASERASEIPVFLADRPALGRIGPPREG